MPSNLLNNPQLMEKTILNREWLSKRTKDELQRIIIQLTKEISNTITTKMAGVPSQLQSLGICPGKIKI